MIKNHIEVKGDVALIHVSSRGKTVFAMIDKEDLESLNKTYRNRLNVDSNGAIQLRSRKNGNVEVVQLQHHILGLGHNSNIGVKFLNGNKLDCRKKNLRV